MDTKHTPGPWFFKASGLGGFEILDMPDCWDAAVLCSRFQWERRRDESVANGRLMAAAPDLLAALKQCAGVLSGEDMSKGSLIAALEVALAAMKKATGAAP